MSTPPPAPTVPCDPAGSPADGAADGAALAAYIQTHAPCFYLAFDAAGVVRATNTFTTTLLGAPLGRTFREVFLDFQGTLDPAALAQQPATVHTLDVATTDRLPQTVQCTFQPVGDHLLALGHVDIAGMEAMQRQFLVLNNELNVTLRALQKANAQLASLNQLKNRFLGFAAHDLRNPIGVIQSYTEFLQAEAGAQLAPEHREFLDIIHGRALAASQLIRELLDLALIESDRHEVHLQRATLAQVFALATLSVQQLAGTKGVQLETTLEPDLPALEFDRLKLEQTVINLLSNAVQHTAPQTTVRLAARRDGGNVRVSVTDAGPGIPAELLGQLFQPFTRGGPTKPGGHESHGLGLAIARRMVEAHRGRIWAANLPEGGAQFCFTLPLPAP